MRFPRRIGVYARPLVSILVALALFGDCLAWTYSLRSLPSSGHSDETRPSKSPKQPESLSKLRNDKNDTATASEDNADLKRQIAENYGKLPLSFEINKGQIDRQVKFFSRGAGYGLYLTSTEAVMVLNKPAELNSRQPDRKNKAESLPQQVASREVIRMKLLGANQRPRALGLEELPGKSNYFIGNDPTKWRTNVSNYAKVKFEKVYPGIDMIYYGNQQQLEYDFVVSPQADASVIKLSFEGMNAIRVEESGDLVLSAKGGDLRQHKPIVYQEIDGRRHEIAASYVRIGEREVGFKLGAYDRNKPLIIDPVISYSTYLGGQGGYDYGKGIAVDASGNAFVVGETGSPNFPTRFSLQPFGGFAGIRGDAFVTKLNATGTQFLFSTYLGGASVDVAEDVAVDAAGNCYLTGWTTSNDFPTTAGAFQTNGGSRGNLEAFITKINSAGSALMYSTYVTGRDDDSGYGIAVDSGGHAYVIGRTDSNNFPTTANALQPSFNDGTCGQSPDTFTCFDAFVIKLNPTGTGLVYSTYLGGTGDDGANWDGDGIFVDSAGSAYVTGFTRSTDFPTVNAFQPTHAPGQSPNGPSWGLNSDVFVTKFDPSGQTLVYSTFLGGSGEDAGNHVVVDTEGFAYVTGRGSGANGFPITPGAFLTSGASFVTKLSPAGNELVYSTNLAMFSYSLAIDSAGNAYVVGQLNISGFRPVNVTKVNPTGTGIIFSYSVFGTESQFGGDLGSQTGRDIALDSSGNMYVTGDTFTANFPVTSGAPQQNFGGNICSINFCNDGFVLKIADINGHQISGHVTDSAGNSLSGVKMSLSGGLKTYVFTDANGDYSFNDLMPGRNYSITPSLGFFTFAPASQTFNNLSADQTADFVGTLPSVTLSGAVTNANNAGISGVTVTLSGSQSQTQQTNTSGSYSFSGLPAGGNYTVTPSRGSDVYDPVSKTFSNMGQNQTANFKLVYQISGQVTDAVGNPTPGVTLTLSGPKTGVTETDVNGNYLFTNVPANGNYTVTPSKAGILTFTFTPPNATLTNLSSNQVANFSFTTSTRVSLFPIADAYVQDGTTAGANFGAVTPMLLKTANQSGNRRDVYLKFDLTSVSRNITSAKLRITAALSAAGGISTSVYSVVDTSWLESDPGGINWTNKPARSATALATATVATTTYATYELDITGYIVSEKAAGRDPVSLALHNPSNSSNHITVHSREATADKPQLLITTSDVNNAAPSVSLTAPAGAPFVAPANITVNATASDSDGSVSKVDFYAGTALIGTDNTAPYSIQWNSVAAGSYSLKAVATDNSGATTISDAINVVVNAPNSPPEVLLTAPAGGLTFAAGESIGLSAQATDVDGSISKVDFFTGAVLIGTDTSSPYNVVWNNASAGAHALTAVATDNAGGTAISPAVNVNVVWRTGLSPTADAYVRDGSSASTNFGTALELQVQASAAAGSNRESYLKFDITTITGVANAKLRLFGALLDNSGANIPASVYPVALTSWVESGNGSITWNNKPPAGSNALATTTVTDNVGRWYEWDITAYVQAEKLANRNIISLVVKNPSASTPHTIFNSREATSNQPQLLVTTTAARNILLVTGSSTLNTSESAIKSRMENLGFTVTVKAAGSNNNSSVKTTDADGKAAVVISSTVTPANVAAKFRNVGVPVVLWEADLLDDQGMTGTVSGTDFGTTTNQTQLAIIDGTHQLAAGLTGTVSVVTAASSFTWGKPNVNAARIASLTSDSTRIAIFGYDRGAVMPGLPAPARRVGFFLTDANGVNLTASGASLFDAAIKWATATSVAPTISDLTPLFGSIGTSVTVSGYNFGDTQGGSTVTFNGVTATPTSWSSTSITVPVPAGATTGPVVVIVSGLSSNATTFTVELLPLDTDGDGLPDAWELQYFGNLSQGATDDPDGDGLNNLQEYQQGRNPTANAVDDTNGGVNLRIYTPLVPSSP